MTKTKLLEEITYDKIRPWIHVTPPPIKEQDVDYVVSLVIHRVRKMIRAAGLKRKAETKNP